LPVTKNKGRRRSILRSLEDNEFIITQFSRYGRMVLRIACQNTASMADAEDITQEVFMKLMKEVGGFAGDEHIKAWLIRVTINKCKDYFRSSRFRSNVAFTEENLPGGYYADSYPGLEDRQVFAELRKLPSKYRNVIYLHYIEEYSVPEIAKLLGANENTVSSWLRRAKRKLKMNLEGEGSYEEGKLYCSDAKN
jgi:RNA polymerase sigma-70 factor (ECF subfamily)